MSILKQIEIKATESDFIDGISSMTGTRVNAVSDFVKKYDIDISKLFHFLNPPKMSKSKVFINALSGKNGNKDQKEIIKKFGKKKIS